MRLYTKSGDKGRTSLIGGRVFKNHIRVEAYGTLDELNSFVGKAITEIEDEVFNDLKEDLIKIQHEIFDSGSDLSVILPEKERKYRLDEAAIQYLEKRIDELTDEAPDLEYFILPGGTPLAASLHISRTIARRAERKIVALIQEEEDVPEIVLQYVNRLSDYFFAAARVANCRANVKDVAYERSAKVFHTKKSADNEKKDEEK
ncbi:MAG TPA: cob(I)yrinic acid a,c-diamide adenosyltransferase [Pseudogracilibacillus sp.]|nr:cob(I)yrinic acid a,c-diamide adenosyltransferase [Pseudogracilibacillus sp.]